jgi:uncharacterized membrane protein
MVREWIALGSEGMILAINALVLIAISLGTFLAVCHVLQAMLNRTTNEGAIKVAYLRYGHWLVAALTFQIAADILETSMAPNWQDIGRLGAIAAIRILISFFLDRDIRNVKDEAP